MAGVENIVGRRNLTGIETSLSQSGPGPGRPVAGGIYYARNFAQFSRFYQLARRLKPKIRQLETGRPAADGIYVARLNRSAWRLKPEIRQLEKGDTKGSSKDYFYRVLLPRFRAGKASEQMFTIALDKVGIRHISQSTLKDISGKTIYTVGRRGGHRVIDESIIDMYGIAHPLEVKLPLTPGGGGFSRTQLIRETKIYEPGVMLTSGNKKTGLSQVVDRPTLVPGWATISPPHWKTIGLKRDRKIID